jgi:DNA-directed RNA polymerase subunit B
MATGNWIGRATGVSKFMDRVNYLSPLTAKRKVKSPLNKNRELYEARDVHGTHWGRVDAIETPDGPQCGLVKNLSLMASVTTEVPEEHIEKVLYEKGVKLE